MSEVQTEDGIKRRGRPSLQTAKSQATAHLSADAIQEEEITVNLVDVPNISDIPEDEDLVVEDRLIGWDPKRKSYAFISPVPSLIIMFRVARIDKDGEFILTQLGDKVYDEFDAKFRNGWLLTTPAMAKHLLAHKSYGGQGETITANPDPLFYLDNYPQHEWKVIKEREQFITKEEKAYEE